MEGFHDRDTFLTLGRPVRVVVGSESETGVWDACWGHNETAYHRHGKDWDASYGGYLAVLSNVWQGQPGHHRQERAQGEPNSRLYLF